MKVTITINKQVFHRDIPITWDQVSFGDFLKLDECGQDVIKVIALLTRIDYEQLKKAHIKNLDQIVSVLGFLKKPMDPPDAKSIKYLHGYKLPDDLEFEETQMFLDLQKYVTEAKDLTPLQQLERFTLYCAVYACKRWKGAYDWKHAEELAPTFLNAPCTEVMAIGNFTLLRLIGLNLNINPASLNRVTPLKKFRLALKGFRLRMVYRLHSMIWLKRLGVKKTNY